MNQQKSPVFHIINEDKKLKISPVDIKCIYGLKWSRSTGDDDVKPPDFTLNYYCQAFSCYLSKIFDVWKHLGYNKIEMFNIPQVHIA